MNIIKSFQKRFRLFHFSTKNILLMRFIIANFIIILVSSVGLSVFSLIKTNQTISQNTDAFSSNQLYAVTNSVDDSINEIYRFLWSLNTNNDETNIFAFTRWTKEDKYNLEFVDWYNSFNRYIKNYEFLESVYVLRNDIIIDSNSGIQLLNESSNRSFVLDTLSAAKKEYQVASIYISDVHTIDSVPVISLVSPINLNDKEMESGIIILNIRQDYLSKKIGSKQQKTNYLSYIVSDNSKIVAASSKKYNAEVLKEAIEKPTTENTDKTYIIDNTEYIMYCSDSQIVFGWKYMILYDNSSVINQKKKISTWYVIIFLITIIICFISTIFISLYIYKPLQNIISNLRSSIDALPNAGLNKRIDETKVISTHIKTIEDDLTEKTRFITNNMPKLRRITISNLLEKDCGISLTELKSDLTKCGIIFADKYYYVASFIIDRYVSLLSETSASEINSLAKKIYNTVYDELSLNMYSVGIRMNANKYVFILNIDRILDSPDIMLIHRRINESLIKITKYTVSFCISENTTQLKNISLLYENILSLEKYIFTEGCKALIECPYKRYYKDIDEISSSKCVQNIVHAVFHENMQQITSATEIFYNLLASSGPDAAKKSLLDLFENIKKELKSDTHNYDFNSVAMQLNNLLTYASLNECTEYISSKLLEINVLYKTSNDSNLPKKIKEYIDLYYYKDLSLDILSDVFKISPSYISKLFIETYKTGFLNYLSDIRIKKAKELLIKTDMPIQLISQKIGFTNYNSFSRTFKRYTGTSAKNYRMNFHIDE